MASEQIKLKQRGSNGNWYLYAPKGHELAGPFRGNEYKALEWGRSWISSFNNWTLVLEEESKDEKKD